MFSLLCSCGPSRLPEPEMGKYEGIRPTELEVGADSGRALLKWRTNRRDVPIQGYNVYISEHQMIAPGDSGKVISADVPAFNTVVYPGDTDPAVDYETFEANGLTDGIVYRATVTIVFADGEESRHSNVVRFICHPQGEFSLRQRYRGEQDGYSFAASDYVRSNDLGNQIYYAVIDGDDFLLSPSRLDDVLESTEFYPSEIRSIYDSFDPPSGPGLDKIGIYEGMGCLLKTEAGQYVKVIVAGFSGTGDDRRVDLMFSFMPLPGYSDF